MRLCCQHEARVLYLRLILYLIDLIRPNAVEDIEEETPASGVESLGIV